jgi:hypothetical protein
MNRQQLTYVRVVALFMAGMVAILALGNLFTVATKSISVEIPTEEDFHWSVDPVEHVLLFRTSFSVENQGAYDIKDIDISAHLVKDGRTSLVSFEKQDMVIVRGGNTTVDLLIPLDLATISWFDWLDLMYQNSNLTLMLDINAKYMFGLIKFTADEAINVPWTPPIPNLFNDTTVRTGIDGLLTLLKITQNSSVTSLSDLISLLSLPQISYASENGFAFSLVISNYSETLTNITFHLVAPFLVIDGGFEFKMSILAGIEEGRPVLRIQEVCLQYVD